MIRVLAFITLFTCSGLGYSADEGKPIPVPNVKVGDKWTYQVFTTEGRKSGIYEVRVYAVTEGVIGSTLIEKETGEESEVDWTPEWTTKYSVYAKRFYDRPFCSFKFPLVVGATWKCHLTQVAGGNAARRTSIDPIVTVVGWENIDVPAGTFRALKIEFIAEVQVSQGIYTVKGAFWYAPEVKRYVKHFSETRDPQGTMSNRVTEDLREFKLNPEWAKVPESDDDRFYFDPASIRKDSDLVRVEILNNLPNKTSMRSMREYDCKNGRTRSIVKITIYASPMGSGKQLHDEKPGSDWEDFPPGSRLALFFKSVCAK